MVVSEGQVSGGDKCPDTVVDADERISAERVLLSADK